MCNPAYQSRRILKNKGKISEFEEGKSDEKEMYKGRAENN
jgi:hypothetical protein